MNKDRWNIDYPEEHEVQQELHKIVRTGLQKQRSFTAHVKDMWEQIGFRHLFHDATEILFMLVIGLSALGLGWLFILEQSLSIESIYAVLFTSSPLVYAVLALYFFVRVKESNMFNLEMTCKYNMFQLAAFRMLIFGIVAVVLNGLVTVIVSLIFPGVQLIEALCLSTASLSIFAVSFLYVEQKTSSKWGRCAFLMIWVSINMIFVQFSSDLYVALLSKIPVFVYGIIIICSAVMYVRKLKQLITYPKGVL